MFVRNINSILIEHQTGAMEGTDSNLFLLLCDALTTNSITRTIFLLFCTLSTVYIHDIRIYSTSFESKVGHIVT